MSTRTDRIVSTLKVFVKQGATRAEVRRVLDVFGVPMEEQEIIMDRLFDG